MLLPDALEESVERGALARLFGHDKDGEPELFRHLHGGVVRALHDDVDVEVYAVIRLPQDGIEEIADDAALVAGGDEERDAPLRVYRFAGGKKQCKNCTSLGIYKNAAKSAAAPYKIGMMSMGCMSPPFWPRGE